MAPPPTRRLYLDEPRRKTALATVTAHHAGGFLLDRTLYHASDPRYHHKQPSDKGHVLAEGHKIKLRSVGWHHDHLVHRTAAALPTPGAQAQLHLDADLRDQHARAHTAMHLLVAALAHARAELLAMPEVVGGGHVNAHARFREPPQAALADLTRRLQTLVDQRLDVVPTWAPRDEAARRVTHHPIALDAIAPQEPTLRLVTIGEDSCLPCDAPHVANTREIGRIHLTHARPAKEGVRWQMRVQAPEK